MPVPERHGEPSVFKHVIYVIKENRTYDQVLRRHEGGQRRPEAVHLRRGGDAQPARPGPASSRCSTTSTAAACSAPTAISGSTRPTSPTTWRRRSAASRAAIPTRAATRSPSPRPASSGTTPWPTRRPSATTASSSKTSYTPKGTTWADVYPDFKTGTRKITIEATAERQAAASRTPTRPIPCFPLTMPDVYRAELFLDELKEFEQKGDVAAT